MYFIYDLIFTFHKITSQCAIVAAATVRGMLSDVAQIFMTYIHTAQVLATNP